MFDRIRNYTILVIGLISWSLSVYAQPVYPDSESNASSTDGGHIQSAIWNEHTGAYIEGTFGSNLAYVAFSTSITDSNGNVVQEGGSGLYGYGLSTAIGYNFTTVHAIEAGFIHSDLNEYDDNNKSYKTLSIPYLTARFNIPIADKLTLITKAGLMFLSATYSESDGSEVTAGLLAPFMGVGLGYAITENIDINMQYQGITIIVAGAGLLSAGVTYHF